MIWKELKNWKYEYLDGTVDADSLGDFAPLVKLWQEKRGNRKMPAWSDFDFTDFRGWHSRFSKSTLTSRDPLDWRIDIFGDEFADVYGAQWAGTCGSDTDSVRLNPEEEKEFYKLVVDNAYISYVSGNLPWKGMEYKRMKLIEFPLSDDGDLVTHFIEFLAPLEA